MAALLAGALGLLLASARSEIANYISTLIDVYVLVIFAHIVVGWLLAFGVRLPYSRTTTAVIGFLRDVCEPFLRIFRRVLPSFGGMDFSPIVAIIVLELVNSIVVQGLIGG